MSSLRYVKIPSSRPGATLNVLLCAGIIVAAAVAIALIVLVWYFVFRDTTALGDPMTTTVYRGSIQSTVEGYGLTKAKDSATITPGTGTILELFVQEGLTDTL